MSKELISIITKVPQIPLVIFITLLCGRAISILKIPGLFWISFSFLFNCLYIISSICHDLHFTEITFEYLAFFADITCSFCFCLGSIWIIKPHKIIPKQRLLLLVLNFCLFAVLAIFKLKGYNNLTITCNCIYDAICLSIVAEVFRYDDEDEFRNARKFIVFGFRMWAVLQLLTLLPVPLVIYGRTILDTHVTILGFASSLIAKFLILLGIFLWYVSFAMLSNRKLGKETTEKEQLLKARTFFESILARTFHEITLPLKALGNSIEDLTSVSRALRPKAEIVQNNFERVKTIITVSKNSYKRSDNLEFEDNWLNAIDGSGDNEKVVSVNTLIEIAIRQIKNSFRCEFIPRYGTQCHILCNQTEVIQILSNLFKNSVEAYQFNELKDQKIFVRSYVKKDESNSSKVIVEVDDLAGGILPEHVDKIWLQGFSTKQKDDNNIVRGQGLHITRDLMKKYGEITVESPKRLREGLGTQFMLAFNHIHLK